MMPFPTAENDSVRPPLRPSAPKRILRLAAGYGIAAACLAWVMHDIRPEALWKALTSFHAVLLLPAVAFDAVSYWSQGFRWKLLLHPLGRLSTLRSTQAVYAGLFTNEIMPMRAGELVRAFLVSRWLSAGVVRVIPSMVVERMFDGIWVALGMGLTAIFVRLPRNLLRAADVLGVAVIASMVLFVGLVFRRRPRPASVRPNTGWKPLRWISALTGRLADGIAEIGLSRPFFLSFFSSALILIFQIAAFWLVMRAYGLRVSIWEGAAVHLIVHFGTAIPNAPSNVGTYQFFTVLGLTLFGVDKTTATGFSLAVFVVLTVPLWLIGFFAVSRTGLTFRQIRSAVRDMPAP
jgi:glycosyltransferase 2 family protein